MLLYDNFELVQKCCDSAFYLTAINGLRRILSPASKASREVANLTERKNPHTPVYGVKEFFSLSVCYNVIRLSNMWE